ncbi:MULTISPECIES: YbhB/YbcL family Raf kinase inhibitor-like protein [Mycobacteroides]|uniref:YbhB/YbcL family Raf kinase inhibitor-like protein n=1 Tax=Mycobacteroides TaxID=670516 RepID=UPI0009BE051B|nr:MULTISPECIES: YbhB/YbcL family Raf kinase inhibitor-like protein [Mycobacteroides]
MAIPSENSRYLRDSKGRQVLTRPSPYDLLPPVPAFALLSDDIADGQPLAVEQRSAIFGAQGGDRSPHLSWSGFPAETKSFAVTCYDADAPTASGFWHWAVFDIPPDITELPSGARTLDSDALPLPAITLANDIGTPTFVGASPPPGHGPHRYFFAVHALNAPSLGLSPTVSPAWLGFHLYQRTIARAVITSIHETPN